VFYLAAIWATPLILGDLKPDYVQTAAHLGGQVIPIGRGVAGINNPRPRRDRCRCRADWRAGRRAPACRSPCPHARHGFRSVARGLHGKNGGLPYWYVKTHRVSRYRGTADHFAVTVSKAHGEVSIDLVTIGDSLCNSITLCVGGIFRVNVMCLRWPR
jgi:hypothetical protein